MWTSLDVCRLAGLSYRRLDYMTRLGVLDPVLVEAASGSGSQRLFSADAPAVAWIVALLTDVGIRVSRIAPLVDRIALAVQEGESPLDFGIRSGGELTMDRTAAVISIDWLSHPEFFAERMAMLLEAVDA